MILGFQGEYRWLSNFWPAVIRLDSVVFPTVEHAYVARKLTNESWAYENQAGIEWFTKLTPAQVKRHGRELGARPDWEAVKLGVMYELTSLKYSEDNPDLREKLLATGDEYIEETNHWGDTFWGVCNGEGENWLGVTIMEVRDDIRKYLLTNQSTSVILDK